MSARCPTIVSKPASHRSTVAALATAVTFQAPAPAQTETVEVQFKGSFDGTIQLKRPEVEEPTAQVAPTVVFVGQPQGTPFHVIGNEQLAAPFPAAQGFAPAPTFAPGFAPGFAAAPGFGWNHLSQQIGQQTQAFPGWPAQPLAAQNDVLNEMLYNARTVLAAMQLTNEGKMSAVADPSRNTLTEIFTNYLTGKYPKPPTPQATRLVQFLQQNAEAPAPEREPTPAEAAEELRRRGVEVAPVQPQRVEAFPAMEEDDEFESEVSGTEF